MTRDNVEPALQLLDDRSKVGDARARTRNPVTDHGPSNVRVTVVSTHRVVAASNGRHRRSGQPPLVLNADREVRVSGALSGSAGTRRSIRGVHSTRPEESSLDRCG